MTNRPLPAALLARFSQFIAEQMGLHFPPDRAADLQRGLRLAAREFEFEEITGCLEWLMSTPLTRSQVEILASNLTVGETYFFRENRSFEILEQHLLPELARSRRGGDRRLRLWSAACCSGEEPYSIAISLRNALPDFADWHITILGTDINPRFLRKAAKGVFSDWSFRNAPPCLKERHFEKAGTKRWKIRSEIKQMVTFSHLNLAADACPSLSHDTHAMDIIFCRNMLIYFAPEQIRKVLHKLHRCLTEGGWLVLSPSETAHAEPLPFVPVDFDGAVLFQKDSTRTEPVDRRARTPEEAEPLASEPCHESISDTSGTAAPVELPSEPVPAEPGRSSDATETLALPLSTPHVEPGTMMLMARALANQGRRAEALGWCDRMISADKLSSSAYYLRACILHEQGNMNEAVQSLQRALYLEPDFVLAHFALGNIARAGQKIHEANKHFEIALSLARARAPEEVLPESDGLTSGRLAEIITGLKNGAMEQWSDGVME